MVLPTNFWLLFLAAMVISSIGFKNYVWFISLGYGNRSRFIPISIFLFKNFT